MAEYGVESVDPRLAPNYIQEVTKTITLALAPYVPFSQRYTMELQQHSGGKISEGFFNIVPTEMGYDATWNNVVESYLSRNDMTPEDMGDEAPNLDHLLNPMAAKLSKLLDSMPERARSYQREMDGTVFGELVGEYSMKALRDVMLRGNEEIGNIPKDINQEILNSSSKGLSREGIDLVRDADSEPFFSAIKKLFDLQHMDSIAAAEVTDSKFKKEISGGLEKGMSPEAAIAQMDKNTERVYGKINKKIKEIAKDLPEGQSKLEILTAVHGGIGSMYKGLGKQFADRMYRLELQQALNPDLDKYLYVLPLGDTGYIASITLGAVWDGDVPQLTVFEKEYAMGGQADQLFIMLGMGVERELALTESIFDETTIQGILVAAANDVTLSKTKEDLVDWAYAAIVDNILDPTAHVDMWKPKYGDEQGKPVGATRFTSSEMAEMLAAQFRAFKGDSQNAASAFSEEWKKIFAESNKATGLWKDNVTKNQVDFDYRAGITENQGVWSENTNNTWTPVKDPTEGINVSMAPAIFSQAGRSVARFSTKMLQKVKGGMVVDDPVRGVKKGDVVKRSRVLLYKERQSFAGKKPSKSAGDPYAGTAKYFK